MQWVGNTVESHVHVAREKFPRVERYLEDMPLLGVSRAALSQNIGNYDNEYLIEAAKRFPDRFKVIVMLDLESLTIKEDIANLKNYPEVVGVRLWANTKVPGSDDMQIWREIYESGLVASVRGPVDQIYNDYFVKVLTQFPSLKVRIEHLGSFNFSKDKQADFDLFMKMARFKNLYLMWAGFYANSGEDYPYNNSASFLRRSLEMFGAQRIMWSGDWNADVEHGSLKVCRESSELFSKRLLLAELLDNDLDWIMGRTADNFLNWQT